MSLTLTLGELAAVVLVSVLLAVTDGSALSRLGVAWLAKKLGVRPEEIRATNDAADDADEEAESAG